MIAALHPDIRMAVDLGLHLFPCVWPIKGRCSCGDDICDNIAKHPKIKGWQEYATTETEILTQWLKAWPSANWGIATGMKSGVIVVDVDPRHGGDEALAELERQHGELATWTALSGGGGRHLYFRHPGLGDIRNSAGVIGPGIDVRGDGGFIIAPPSLHVSGRPYAWDVDHHPDDEVLADLPQWIMQRIDRPNVATTATAPEEWQARAAPEIPEGQRNQRLAQIAGHLFRRNVDPHLAVTLLLAWNETICRPPLAAQEVETTIASIANRELQRRGGQHAA